MGAKAAVPGAGEGGKGLSIRNWEEIGGEGDSQREEHLGIFFCYGSAVWFKESQLPSLNLSFPTCKMQKVFGSIQGL